MTQISPCLNDFFNINYIKAFHIYYNNCKPLEKVILKGKEILLSSKTEEFSTLLIKNEELKDEIISVAQAVYFNGENNFNSKFIVTK